MSNQTAGNTNDLIGFISKQLNPEHLSSIINESILKSLSQYVDQYIKREIEALICTIVKKEIDSIKNHIQVVIVEFYNQLQKNLDMFRSLQIQLANKGMNKNVDPICEAFDRGNYSEGFSKILVTDDDSSVDQYLKILDFSKIGEENLDQKVAIEVANWAISRPNKELLEKMISIIQKGEGLASLLRKIVSKQNPLLSQAKAMIIKKSL